MQGNSLVDSGEIVSMSIECECGASFDGAPKWCYPLVGKYKTPADKLRAEARSIGWTDTDRKPKCPICTMWDMISGKTQ